MSEHRAELLRFLKRVQTRQVFLAAIEGIAAGLALSVVVVAAVRLVAGNARGMQGDLLLFGLAAIPLFALAGATRAWRRRDRTAAAVERRAPESRNIVLTASELVIPSAARDLHLRSPDIIDLVTARAAAAVRSLDAGSLFPARRALIALGLSGAVWLGAIALTAARDPDAPVTLGAAVPRNEVGSIQIVVTPPAYTRRPVQRLTNPARIDAIAGSRIALTVRGSDIHVETVEGQVPATTPNEFALVAQADGFIAIRAGASDRRLIGLTVTPDQTPRVRVTAPGKDMFIADANRHIPVDLDARDDLGLVSLKLRYTKVSGSGERFTFVEGEVPVTVSRADDKSWTAKGVLDLGALKLEQGDMVVYRAAAADTRPGAPLTESDAFIVEITSPLSIAAEGFSVDDQQDKYALSQQMVILKTERLLARATTMLPESVTYYSQNIAAEQRSVRAEFVFMMGGEVAEDVIAAAGMDIDETREAEGESELAAGRMVNRGRVALVDAIRLMSKASSQLNNVDPKSALPDEKAALAALQQAFSRTRYLLRALTQRERLDLSRRLTGVLSLAARDAQPQALPSVDPAVVSLRRSLAAIAVCHAAAADGSASCSRSDASRIAQEVLAVDPSEPNLQRVAARLGDMKLDDAAVALADELRERMPRADATSEPPELRKLRGSLNDALRAGGKR
jgi:hypothetical protein